MTTTKHYQLNAKYRAVVEIDGQQILIYIEEKYRYFFKWIEDYRVISWPKLIIFGFEFGNVDSRFGCSINGIFAGRVRTLDINHRNASTFNLKSEIDTIFANYLEGLKQDRLREKQMQQIINQIT